MDLTVCICHFDFSRRYCTICIDAKCPKSGHVQQSELGLVWKPQTPRGNETSSSKLAFDVSTLHIGALDYMLRGLLLF